MALLWPVVAVLEKEKPLHCAAAQGFEAAGSRIQVVAEHQAVAHLAIRAVDGVITQWLAHGDIQRVVAVVGDPQTQAG